ncbi:MAG: phosphoglycerate mutase [Anaerolineae bacterium SM23_84]|nr:MAG: phosphoglycerate mutase [Anaerolineae bacterium SM23_84]
MADLEFIRKLVIPAETKIVFLVMDGIGGLPVEEGGPTELEAARTPNLDALAAKSLCGLTVPITPGITPGSGPGHLGVFGYDPCRFIIGRGVLEALGIDFDLQPQDVAARGNFCSVDAQGRVTDRRAGRIPTEKNAELVALLRDRVRLPGVELIIETVKEHRFVLVFRGEGLAGDLTESDPQQLGVLPLPVRPLEDAGDPAASQRTADLANDFVRQTREALKDQHPANMVLLRGLDKRPEIPSIRDVFGLRAAAIAVYPMYRGLAKLVGMTALPSGNTLADECDTLEKAWPDYDFFYVHYKYTDSRGEDGDFAAKVAVIEECDSYVPRIVELKPDVLVITGDHSTPSLLRAHSWHPIPTMLYSRYCRCDSVREYGERACMRGGLGHILAVDLMPLAMANALRLTKFGA